MENDKILEKRELLSDILPEISGPAQDQFRQFLASAPAWLSGSVIHLRPNTTFIKEGDGIDNVYMLLDGSVHAVDFRVMGADFHYMYFYPVMMFGSMELLLGMPGYRNTLVTSSCCEMVVIPASVLLNWLCQDPYAMMLETKRIISCLINEIHRERVFLFTRGCNRIMYILTCEYKVNGCPDICSVSLKRKEWSDMTGLSTKTVDRSLSRLEEKGLIIKERNKITFTYEQYRHMEQQLSGVVSELGEVLV